MPSDPTTASDASAAASTSTSLNVGELAENIERGFLGTHTQLSHSYGELFQLTARLTGLAELLVEKGVLQAAEIQGAVEKASTELQNTDFGKGLKFALLSGRPDKYQVQPTQVNCAERLPYCQSACCSLDVVLSPQDVEEGAVRWDLAHPYHLRRSGDGYCCHLQRDSGGCEVYERRPYVCRSYSCVDDKRIWLDFEKMIPNEETLTALRARRDQPRLIARNVGSPDAFQPQADPPKSP
jgi:Fe-S-cluster containining protein